MTEDYKPKPDQDGGVHKNAEGDEVKVVDGKATPTEETVKKAESLQASGDEVAEEKKRDAAAAAEGVKEPAQTSTAGERDEGEKPKPERKPLTDEEKEARLKRAAEAKAARAAAAGDSAGTAAERPARAPRAEKTDENAEPPKPKEPSRNQPFLDSIVKLVNELVGQDAIEQAVINERGNEIPTLTVKSEYWSRTAETIKMNPELSMNYLRNLSGVDQETHLEVVYHLINMTTKKEICVKVKADREQPVIPSVTPLWPTANWHEREVYDLLGVEFPGHPDLRRIMLADDWVGHPLRKDYEPIDPEV